MIGVGDRGKTSRQIRKVPNVELVAMADIYSRRRDEAKSKVPGIQTLDDYRRLLDMKDIDGVIVASPLHIHARHFIDTLAAGKDLYSEKTMTWSIPEAEQCLAAAKEIRQGGPDRPAARELRRAQPTPESGSGMVGGEGDSGGILDGPQHASRQGPVGAPRSFRLHRAERGLEGLSQRPPRPPFDPYKLINWRLFWKFSGGNCTENMVHQIAWIMSALDLPLPSAAYMSGGVFSEKDGRQVPDTMSVTSIFPMTWWSTWQSTFSNRHYGLGDRILGSDGTLEHHFEEPLGILAGESEPSEWGVDQGASPNQDHMKNWIDCIRSRGTPNAPVELGYRSALAVHMANLSYRHKKRMTLEEAKAMQPEYS